MAWSGTIKYLSFLFSILVLCSCRNKFELLKKRYSGGYTLAVSGKMEAKTHSKIKSQTVQICNVNLNSTGDNNETFLNAISENDRDFLSAKIISGKIPENNFFHKTVISSLAETIIEKDKIYKQKHSASIPKKRIVKRESAGSTLFIILICAGAALLLGLLTLLWIFSGFNIIVTIILLPVILALALLLLLLKGH